MTIPWILLMIGSYLVGSIPASFLVAKARGIDLRKHGSQQVGGGNVWRTTSRKLGLLVGIFDFFKGIIMVSVAFRMGFDPALQIAVGVAVVIGHNWPVFLKFHGGRGIATTGGIIFFMPVINDITYWGAIVGYLVLFGGILLFRQTPVAVLIGVAVQPLITAIFMEPPQLTLVYFALLVVIIVKRLTAQRSIDVHTTGFGRVLLNRLLYDRDISDRKAWVHRKHEEKKESD